MKKFIICLLVCCPILLFGQFEDALSLESLIKMAENRSILGEEAQFDLQSAGFNFSIYKADLKPQITGTASLPNYAKTSSEIEQPDGTIRFQPITNNNSSISIQAVQNISSTGGSIFLASNFQRFDDLESKEKFYNGSPVRLGINQPLFGFNRLKWDKKLEPMRFNEAQKKYNVDMEQIKLEAAALFFNLLIANEDLNIAISNRTSNESIFKIAEDRYELGRISENDLLALQLELISANRNKKRAEQSVRLASSNIYTFLGLDYDGQMITPTIPEADETIAVTTDLALQEARSNRHEINTQQRNLLEAERDIAQIKGEGGLNADLIASIGLARGASNFEDIYRDPRQEQFVMLSLSVPIVDWGRQKNQLALSRAQRDFVAKQIKQDRIELENNVRVVVQQFQNIQEELQLVRDLKKVAQNRFDIIKQSYLLSAISITELTLAQREKDQAVREYISTLTRFWSSYYQLQLMTVYDFKKQEKIKF